MTQLIIIGCYLILLLCLGLFSSRLFRGTSEDYLLASHSIGPFLLLMSLFGTTMTAFSLVGSTGESFKQGIGVYGMLGSSSSLVHSLCFYLFGVRLWSLGKRYGYATQIGFFRDRFGSNGIGLLLFPVLVALIIPYLLLGIMAAGGTVQGVTSGAFPGTFPATEGAVPAWLGSLVICLVVLTYVFFGGMRGTAWANTFQTLVFMILGVVTFFVIASRLGGRESLLENLRAATQAVPIEKLTRTGMSRTKFLTYMLVPFSVGMFPHVFQHWLTAKSARSFKLPVVMHPVFVVIVWVPCVLVGVWGTSSLIDVSVPPNQVLSFMVNSLAGNVLGGFLTAGILAAIMSSLDSQFLCLGTMFTHDIAIHFAGRKRFTDRQVVLMARCFIIAVCAITYALSLAEPRRVFVLGVWCFSGFASLVPLLSASLFWKRTTLAGAYSSIVAAFGSFWYLFDASDYAANPSFAIEIAGYQFMPVTAMVACSTSALVIVSLLTRGPSAERLARFFPGDSAP